MPPPSGWPPDAWGAVAGYELTRTPRCATSAGWVRLDKFCCTCFIGGLMGYTYIHRLLGIGLLWIQALSSIGVDSDSTYAGGGGLRVLLRRRLKPWTLSETPPTRLQGVFR